MPADPVAARGMPVKVPEPFPPHALRPARDELAFRFRHGAVARSLKELAEALSAAPPEVVWYHREHLVPWVRDVAGDAPLARRMAAYASPPPAPDVLRDVLVALVEGRVAALRRAAGEA